MKKFIERNWLLLGIVYLFLLASSNAIAHNRVVVVPLGGSQLQSFCQGSFTNSVGMTFSLLPAGTFTMGSPADELGRDSDEETQHQVALTESFYMQTTEVTQVQWEAVITSSRGSNPSSFSGEGHPVIGVNWYDAASFANWLSFDEGLIPCYGYDTCSSRPGENLSCTNVTLVPGCNGYRLPTEAQWEYAARAGTNTATYNGNLTSTTCDPLDSNLNKIAWFCATESTPHFVAWKKPNNCGLYDMLGNVEEWCQDWWDGSDYSPEPQTNPTGDATGLSRVVRGGAYNIIVWGTRSAYRKKRAPEHVWGNLGFRLVLPYRQ